jgi:hypothetical protein
MDGDRFDQFTKLVGAGQSRRRLLKTLSPGRPGAARRYRPLRVGSSFPLSIGRLDADGATSPILWTLLPLERRRCTAPSTLRVMSQVWNRLGQGSRI